MPANPEYTAEHISEFSVPFRVSPSALAVHMTMLSNMFPTQFINSFTLRFDERLNRTFITVITNGERWPGQFDFDAVK